MKSVIQFAAGSNEQPDQTNITLVKVITKLTVLVSIALISTWVNAFVGITELGTGAGLMIDALCNTYCCLLTFSVYRKTYKKYKKRNHFFRNLSPKKHTVKHLGKNKKKKRVLLF